MDLITAEQGAHAGDGFIETLSCSSMEKLITKSNRLTDSVVRRQVDAGDPRRGDPCGGGRDEGAEGFSRHHEGVAEHTEVDAVAHFLGEDVTRVDCTRDVVQVYLLGLDAVADCAVFEANVAHTFGGSTFGPVDGALVVVVEAGGGFRVGEVHVVTPVAKREDFLDGFVGSADFGFAGRAACAGLADGLPSDGAAAAHDEKAAHGAVFEHLHLRAVVESRADLTTPVGVAETLERLAVGWRCSVGVGLAVVRRRVVKICGGGC